MINYDRWLDFKSVLRTADRSEKEQYANVGNKKFIFCCSCLYVTTWVKFGKGGSYLYDSQIGLAIL